MINYINDIIIQAHDRQFSHVNREGAVNFLIMLSVAHSSWKRGLALVLQCDSASRYAAIIVLLHAQGTRVCSMHPTVKNSIKRLGFHAVAYNNLYRQH